MMILDGTLPATLACLAAITDPGQRLRIFTGAIIKRGGTIILPPDAGDAQDHWGPHVVEFSLHGILGTGATPSEALAEWTKCATRQVEAERIVREATAPPEDLQEACLLVRTRSRDPAAIDQGRRLQAALAMGMQ